MADTGKQPAERIGSFGRANRSKACGATSCAVLRSAVFAIVLLSGTALSGFETKAVAEEQAVKPYDTKLLRLTEIIGAVHYLRELCGSGDGQLWRDQMRGILKAEGATALRRARLTRSFNKGYQSYSRTYKVCTASAKTAIERFLDEGTEIAEELVKNNP